MQQNLLTFHSFGVTYSCHMKVTPAIKGYAPARSFTTSTFDTENDESPLVYIPLVLFIPMYCLRYEHENIDSRQRGRQTVARFGLVREN